MQTAEIKKRFLGYFERTGHVIVPSAPLPFDDPNLLFVNAGMVQFVPYFIGQVAAPWDRATSVQKCIRTQDIDEVGKTTRHGTFFQMNGNFSFGDYFKEGAIKHAWTLSTGSRADGGFGLDPERIWATVYLDDEQAVSVWHDVIGLPMDRIVRRGMDDNFWSMGIPGPSGPCSELYYDRGPDYGAAGGPEVDEDRYMEFWNLVFMQNERGVSTGPGKSDFDVLGELPRKNIDTGMGMERMATLLQGVDNMYEIDEMRPILDRAAALSGKDYGAKSGHAASESDPDDVRLRVIADHTRTAIMLIGDGVTPSNEGRGYVLRRILRRTMRSMRQLGYEDSVLPELLPVARDCMSPSYPELATEFGRIEMIAYAEEETFRRTLAAGTTILDTAIASAKEPFSGTTTFPAESTLASKSVAAQQTPTIDVESTISGRKAFQLHDTYGFPIELTLEIAAEQGVSVDEDGFRRLMAEQRQRSQADTKGNKAAHANNPVFRELRAKGPTEFLAYTELSTESTVLGLVHDGGGVGAAVQGQTVDVVLDRTPFYAESGGQIADEGVILGANGARLRVLDVQRPVKGLIAHRAVVEAGELSNGETVSAEVDPEWRTSARQAHSGTHVVHAALRQVLGPSALQSGSYNKPGYLRLDFAWGSGLKAGERGDIEDVANQALRHDLPVDVRYMTLEQARAAGALALFGETYGEEVRVVDIGGAWSRELCGGTHVAHASQIGAITVLGESSVGAGVRRLEAYVGIEALRFLSAERALVNQLSDSLKARPEELPERVAALVARLRTAEKQLERVRAGQILARAGEFATAAQNVNGTKLATVTAPAEVSGGDLRALATEVRARLGEGPGVVVAVSDVAGVEHFVTAVNADAQAVGLRAGELVSVLAPALGARGGGKADLAQGAGGDPALVDAAFAAVRRAIEERQGAAT